MNYNTYIKYIPASLNGMSHGLLIPNEFTNEGVLCDTHNFYTEGPVTTHVYDNTRLIVVSCPNFVYV